jgi:hypothetical protein
VSTHSEPGERSQHRRERNRDYTRSYRKRIARGIHRRTISVEGPWLDALEGKGYLDPALRGAVDEAAAIEAFLSDHLGGPWRRVP